MDFKRFGSLTKNIKTPHKKHPTQVRIRNPFADARSTPKIAGIPQTEIFFSGERPVSTIESGEEMNTMKRSRTMYAPVAQTRSVNYKSVNRLVTISGREFIFDVGANAVPGGSLYNASSRLLRPTDSQLFSWLSGIARKFEEFKFSNLKFVYEPQVSSTEAGQVGLYFDGDPTHLAPGNWNNFINTGANSHGAVWAAQQLVVPKWLYASRASYYTLSEFSDVNQASSVTPMANPTDPMEYFPGIFGCVSEGVTAAQPTAKTLGKVYLEYTVSLKTQNVDGYNITNTVGTSTSGEEVVNSGFGLFYKHLGTPAWPQANGFIYGGPLDYTVSQAGSGYHKRVTVANVKHSITTQDVVLLVSCRVTGVGVTVTPQGALVTNGVVGTYGPLSDTTMSTLGGVAVQISENEPAANDIVWQFQVKLTAGHAFRLLTDKTLTYCHITFSPWAYRLQG